MPSHSHDHSHQHSNHGRAFLIGTLLNIGFVAIEFGFGWYANSVALIADAGHNLSDVLGLLLAWGGAFLVTLRPSDRFSYGLKKSSILAALLNALILLLAVGAIIAEAIRRLNQPETSNSLIVMQVAAAGIVINGITAWLFSRGSHDDINIRGAFLHMAADAGVSAGVVLAGLLTLLTGERWIDPITSLAVAGVILWGTWGLLTESVSMALAGVPKGFFPDQISKALTGLPGVEAAHHLHIWPLSTTETALTVHLVVGEEVDRDLLLRQADAYVHKMYGISHSTIQIELSGSPHVHGPEHDDC